MPTRRTRFLTSDSRQCTGNFFIDEDLLRTRGVTDFDQYATDQASRSSRTSSSTENLPAGWGLHSAGFRRRICHIAAAANNRMTACW